MSVSASYPSSRDLRQQVVAIHKSAQADSSTAQSPESTTHTAQTSSTSQHCLTQAACSTMSAKRKRFIPTPLPLAQKQTSDRFLFLQSRGEPRTPTSSQKAAAGHYCPPLSRFLAPRSGREEVAPCGATEKIDSASAESMDFKEAVAASCFIDCHAVQAPLAMTDKRRFYKKWILV